MDLLSRSRLTARWRAEVCKWQEQIERQSTFPGMKAENELKIWWHAWQVSFWELRSSRLTKIFVPFARFISFFLENHLQEFCDHQSMVLSFWLLSEVTKPQWKSNKLWTAQNIPALNYTYSVKVERSFDSLNSVKADRIKYSTYSANTVQYIQRCQYYSLNNWHLQYKQPKNG